MKLIVSRENAVFKRIRALAASVSEQRLQARTLIDGPHLVAAWCASPRRPRQLMVSESGSEKPEILSILREYPDIAAISFRDALFTELSGTKTPVGILAEIDIPSSPAVEVAVDSSSDWLLLDGVQDAGNVGSMLRSAAAFGVRQVFLGEGCAAAWSPKVLRAAQGAHLSLEIWEKMDLAVVLKRFPGTRLATVVENAQSIYQQNLMDRVLWLFGNEGQGVSPGLAKVCDKYVIIPMSIASESLNVAAAAAICMAEAARQKSQRLSA